MSCPFMCFINYYFLICVVDHAEDYVEGGEEVYQGGPSLY